MLALPPESTLGPGSADVVISLIGRRGGEPMQATEIGVTYEAPGGSMSVDLPLFDAASRFGDLRALQGRWIAWTGHPAGDWSGIITGVAPTRASGVVTLSCQPFSYYLKNRFLPNSKRVVTGKPGAVFKVLLTSGARTDSLWIDDIDADEEGDDYSVQFSGQGILDQCTSMATDTDQEFTITPARLAIWRTRLGADLTETVQLNEGVEIVESSPDFDITNVVNDLTVSPAVAANQDRNSREVVDAASVDAIGRQQGFVTTPDGLRPSVLRTLGQRLVTKSAAMGETVSFDVANVNGAFAAFREGDVIRVNLTSYGITEDIHILQRGLVLSENVLHVVGEVAS